MAAVRVESLTVIVLHLLDGSSQWFFSAALGAGCAGSSGSGAHGAGVHLVGHEVRKEREGGRLTAGVRAHGRVLRFDPANRIVPIWNWLPYRSDGILAHPQIFVKRF